MPHAILSDGLAILTFSYHLSNHLLIFLFKLILFPMRQVLPI